MLWLNRQVARSVWPMHFHQTQGNTMNALTDHMTSWGQIKQLNMQVVSCGDQLWLCWLWTKIRSPFCSVKKSWSGKSQPGPSWDSPEVSAKRNDSKQLVKHIRNQTLPLHRHYSLAPCNAWSSDPWASLQPTMSNEPKCKAVKSQQSHQITYNCPKHLNLLNQADRIANYA